MTANEMLPQLRRVLDTYATRSLREMWLALRPTRPIKGARKELIVALARVLNDVDEMCGLVLQGSEGERYALRIVMDADDGELRAQMLLLELGKVSKENAEEMVLGLLRKGLLVGGMTRVGRDGLVLEDHFLKMIRVAVNPVVRHLVEQVGLPGETFEWNCVDELETDAESHVRATPQMVLEQLQTALKVVDAQPLVFTSKGVMRAQIGRKVEEQYHLHPHDFMAWLFVGEQLGVVLTEHDGYERWRRGALAHKLTTEPLAVLSRLPEAMYRLSPIHLWMTHTISSEIPSLRYKVLGQLDTLAVWLTGAVIDVLECIAKDEEHEGPWTEDHRFLPVVRHVLRIWNTSAASMHGELLFFSYGRLATAEELRPLITIALEALTSVGLLERCSIRGSSHEKASRLTAIGRWILRDGAEYWQTGGGLQGLRGRVAWHGDRLELEAAEDAEVVGLALGSLAEAEGEKAFRVTEATIVATVEAGERPDRVADRLERIASGPIPPSVSQAIQACMAQWKPLQIWPGVDAVEVGSIGERERATLVDMGCEQIGDLLLVPSVAVGHLMERIEAREAARIDYDDAPRRSCSLGYDLVLKVQQQGPRDLRLEQLLEELEASPKATSVRLDPDAIPGAGGLDEKALERHLKALLRRMEPFLAGGLTDEVSARFQALAGTVPAPTVQECVVLSFDERIAKGLAGFRSVSAELLSEGRFLVLKKDLAKVEEELSQIGIPFPAEHSTLRESARARAALDRLEEAVASAAPQAPAKKAAANRGGARDTKQRGRRGIDRPEVQEAILEALRRSSQRGGRGSTLGELAAATGHPRSVLRPLLRRLVADGAILLSGHARGARYRLD